MSDILNICVEIMFTLEQGYCLQFFLGSFLEGRMQDRRINGLLVMAVYGVSRLAANFILSTDYESIKTIGKMALMLVIIALLTLLFYRGVRAVTAFLVITFMAVNELVFFLSYMVMQLGGNLFDFWVWLMKNGYIAAGSTVWLAQVTAVVLQILCFSIFFVSLHFILRKITESFRDKDYRIQRTELNFLLVPGLVGLLICVLLRTIMITIENGVPKLLYDRYPILIILIPAIMILSLLSIFSGVKTFQDMIALNREKSSRIILEKQIDSMQEHVKEVEQIYSGVRSMKHDMKNTVSVILQLAAQNGEKENAKLQAYLNELNQVMDTLEMKYKTGNTVVDTLLNMKYHEAVRLIPDLKMEAERLLFPETLRIQSFDIGIILGNALDNAIEACRKLKEKEPDAEAFIRLTSFQKGRMFFMEVENSFDGKILRKKHSEFPITDKPDKKAHGIGLVNIKNTAEKYHGDVDWTVENFPEGNQKFIITIMTQNERSNDNGFRNNK